MFLRHRKKRIYGLAVEKPEIGSIVKIRVHRTAHQFIEKLRKQAVGGTFTAAALLSALNDFIAALPEMVHFGKKLRRLLQIAVHNCAAVPVRLGQPRKKRCIFSKVPRKRNAPDKIVF